MSDPINEIPGLVLLCLVVIFPAACVVLLWIMTRVPREKRRGKA